jgi:hypothetical protein
LKISEAVQMDEGKIIQKKKVWRYQKPYKWTKERSYKRKRTKRQITIFNISHRKLKIEYHEPHKNWERTHVPRKDDQFLLYWWQSNVDKSCMKKRFDCDFTTNRTYLLIWVYPTIFIIVNIKICVYLIVWIGCKSNQ